MVARRMSLLALCALGMSLWPQGQAQAAPTSAAPAAAVRFTVDINQAAADELAQLPGLGPTIAARIIAHRDAHGPFTAPEALLDVPGIGDATLAAIRPHLRPLGQP